MIRSRLRDARRRSPAPARRSIADELEWGRKKLARAGKPHPDMWSLATWAALAGEKPGAIWLQRLGRVPHDDFTRQFRRAIGLQAAGAPFQSAVGRASFRTIDLAINLQVLIPRDETEDLVGQVLSWAAERHPAGTWGTAADIGTGSGPIALSLAVEGRFDRIIATDISPDALEIARRNLEMVRPRTPVEFRLGSLLEPLEGEQVDVVVANPPYLTTAECDDLAPEVRDYEPRLALDGGPDGLTHYRSLFHGARQALRAGSLLALEIDSRRPEETLALAHTAGWLDARMVRDVFGLARYLLATNPKGTT